MQTESTQRLVKNTNCRSKNQLDKKSRYKSKNQSWLLTAIGANNQSLQRWFFELRIKPRRQGSISLPAITENKLCNTSSDDGFTTRIYGGERLTPWKYLVWTDIDTKTKLYCNTNNKIATGKASQKMSRIHAATMTKNLNLHPVSLDIFNHQSHISHFSRRRHLLRIVCGILAHQSHISKVS